MSRKYSYHEVVSVAAFSLLARTRGARDHRNAAQAEFGRRIGGEERIADVPEDRADIDDPAVARLPDGGVAKCFAAVEAVLRLEGQKAHGGQRNRRAHDALPAGSPAQIMDITRSPARIAF